MTLELSILAIFGGFGLLAAGTMARLYPLGICVVLGLAFCQGLASLAGIPGALYGLAIDAMILLLLGVAYTMCKTRAVPFRAPAFWLFLGLSVVFLISAFLNQSDGFTSYRMFRNTLYPYLFFLGVFNLPLNEQQFIRITKFIGVFLVIQIGAAVVKFMLWGVREGGMIGTFGTHAGALSTVFPLFSIGFLLGLYLIYDRRPIFLWIILGFIFFAWGGGKRAFFVILPFVLLGGYLFYLIKEQGRKVSGQQFIRAGLIVIVLSLPVIYLAGRMTPTLNPEGEVGGSFDPLHMVNYVESYHFGQHETYGLTHGRVATFRVAVENVSMGVLPFLFGYGPDAVYGVSRGDGYLQERFEVITFSTGLSRYLIATGVLGSSALILLYCYLGVRSFVYYSYLQSRYWRAMAFGIFLGVFVFLFDFINYSPVFAHSYILPILFFYMTAATIRVAEKENAGITE